MDLLEKKLVNKYYKKYPYGWIRLSSDELNEYIHYVKELLNEYKGKVALPTMEIDKTSINIFYEPSTRSKNDPINKQRELILCKLGNKEINEEWILHDERWNQVNTELQLKINELNPEDYTHYKFVSKGGRKYNYDFEIHFYNENELIKTCNMEFKYGASEVSDCPQWVSPHNPSQYFNMSYEGYFYDNYLPKLCERYELSIPDRSKYLNEIHNDKPLCLMDIQNKYYRGASRSSRYTGLQEDIDNYEFVKQLNNESIKKFLEQYTFNVDTMNEYLRKSQDKKIYILWNNGTFNVRARSLEQYQINPTSIYIKNNNCVCGTTMAGCLIKMLLRWKNGVAYPGFQIS